VSETKIHPTAIVAPGAELGPGVVIGPYCIVEDKVILGAGTVLEPFAQIKRYVRMGQKNRIASHAIIGGEPQHLGFKGEETWVEMADGNTIREFTTIHRGTVQGSGRTTLGSNCFIMGYVHIAHDCQLGNGVIMVNQVGLAGHVVIGDNAFIGAMSGVHQFVRIGERAFIGALSGIGKDVPPFTRATSGRDLDGAATGQMDLRATLHGINTIGLRRSGFSNETIMALKKAYAMIFRTDKTREQALAEVEENLPQYPEVMRFVDFIRSSKRGVTPPAPGNGEE
jgi:UDP-N-acetylglucosamine acyltransferase